MENDIENIFDNEINLSDIGRYGKFIEFNGNIIEKDSKDSKDSMPKSGLFSFQSNYLKCERLTIKEKYEAMKRMIEYLENKITLEVNENFREEMDDYSKILKEKYNLKILIQQQNKLFVDSITQQISEESSVS